MLYFFVKIYLDVDGIPYRELVIERAASYGVTVVAVADYSHCILPQHGVERVMVDEGKDATDFAILNRVQKGDLVITQDVGLACLVLSKGATAISPRGHEFTEGSIGGRLTLRWLHCKVREARGRSKRPRPFSQNDRRRFLSLLDKKITVLKRKRG